MYKIKRLPKGSFFHLKLIDVIVLFNIGHGLVFLCFFEKKRVSPNRKIFILLINSYIFL